MISLINEYRFNHQLKSLGFINNRIYDLYNNNYNQMFTDITTGTSAFQCNEGFKNTKGYDIQSGFGEIKFDGWLKIFSNDSYEYIDE